jgi:hypothetical protein
LDSCLEGKKKRAIKRERKKKEENQQERRKNTVKPSPNLDSNGMGHKTPFLFSLRPRTGNEEENPKKIDLRLKLAVKETEIN